MLCSVLSFDATSGRTGETDAVCCRFCARIRGCQCHLSNAAGKQAEQEGKCFHGRKRRGEGSPLIVSTDQGSDQAVALADLVREDAPGAALAVAGTDGVQRALTLKIDHNGMDGALVAAGIHAHTADQIGARLRTLLDQDAANHGAGDQVEVHRCGVVNWNHNTGTDRSRLQGLVPVVKPSTDADFVRDRMLKMGRQSKEGQGRPVDANGRHRTCHKIMAKKV